MAVQPMSVSSAGPSTVQWATEEEAARALILAMRPGFMILLFAAGWAANVSVFERFRIDYGQVLGLTKEELVRPATLLSLALGGSLVLSSLASMTTSLATGVGLWGVLGAYAVVGCFLFCWLPPAFDKQVRWRTPLARALWRCVVPIRTEPTPFVEVLVADGLTSTAKVFFDLAMVSCTTFNSMELWQTSGILFSVSTQAPGRTLMSAATDQCARSPVPFFFWALPFLIRACQCILTSRNHKDPHTSQMQLINLAKYCSSFPVILCALFFAQGRPEFSMQPEDFEALWAIMALINSLFSLFWDMVMDWGILQATGPPCRSSYFGLRPVLLFRGLSGFYHIAILLNLCGRTLWSLRWSTNATLFLGSFFLATFQQAAEVTRRCLWNLLRVEWECVKRGIHRADKHFQV